MLHFYTPLKRQKTEGVSGVTEMEHWAAIGQQLMH